MREEVEPCVHMIQDRLSLMDTIRVNDTHDYSKLPDKDFIHKCGLCHKTCNEYNLWQHMKVLFD